MSTYGINWANVNLDSSYERSQNILENYNFDTLLLELSCNIPKEKLTRSKIVKHFEQVLQSKVDEAREVFQDNLNNIQQQVINEHNS